MHLHGEQHLGIPPEQTFPGASLPKQAPGIKRLIKATGATDAPRLRLRQGPAVLAAAHHRSGRGHRVPRHQVLLGRAVHPVLRPGVPAAQHLPTGKFDGVVCTDVLEHCPEEDIPGSSASCSATRPSSCSPTSPASPRASACRAAATRTAPIKPVRWWEEHLERAARTNPVVVYEFRLAYIKANALKEKTIASAALSAQQ